MIIQTFGRLQALTPAAPIRFSTLATGGGGAVHMPHLSPNDDGYARIYAAQPNIRIPIDFLAGNVAQLGIHVFRRITDTDRERLADHQLARWLSKPNPATTQFRLIESLLGDFGVYRNAYWLKVPYFSEEWNEDAIGLVRLPPEQVEPLGGLLPAGYVWTNPYDGRRQTFTTAEIVAFGGYNPCNPLIGLSHLETLQSVVAEDAAATAHREYYWQNASRHEGVIERPKEAPKWTEPQKKSFREQWQARFTGAGNSGLVAVLEDGMSFKQTAFSPKDSEFILGGKLRREITAAEYNVPQPSIGILDHATFSNIREQHKQLYQDSLGPTLEMIGQEIERQLLVECHDRKHVYLEFNIAAKLQGSFEEQSNALRLLVGRPIMTANEGRARLNLPAIKDDPSADRLAAQQGGPSDATTGAAATDDPESPAAGADAALDDAAAAAPVPAPISIATLALTATRDRQRASLARIPAADRSSVFFARIDRWNRELAADLAPILGAQEAARVAINANVEFFTELEAMEIAS